MLLLKTLETDMYKRFQVLLTDWQEAYLRYVSEKHDYSFTEILRVFLSLGFLYTIPLLSPEYRPRVTKKQLSKMTKNVARLASTEAERYKFISTVYFEARKAIEYRLSRVKKQAQLKKRKKRLKY